MAQKSKSLSRQYTVVKIGQLRHAIAFSSGLTTLFSPDLVVQIDVNYGTDQCNRPLPQRWQDRWLQGYAPLNQLGVGNPI